MGKSELHHEHNISGSLSVVRTARTLQVLKTVHAHPTNDLLILNTCYEMWGLRNVIKHQWTISQNEEWNMNVMSNVILYDVTLKKKKKRDYIPHICFYTTSSPYTLLHLSLLLGLTFLAQKFRTTLPCRAFMWATASRMMVSLSGFRARVLHAGTMSHNSVIYVAILLRLRLSISQWLSL